MEWLDTLAPEWTPTVFRSPALNLGRGDGPAVALVLGLQRTGSTAARHFLSANFADRRIVLREHGLSPRYRAWLERGAALGMPGFRSKIMRLDQARQAVSQAHRIEVLVTVREPLARAVSHFLYRNRARIGGFHDPDVGGFRQAEAIARDFRAFCRTEAKRQAVWFREELQRTLGCDLAALSRGPVRRDGLHIFLVRCESAERDLLAAGAEIGPVTADPVRRNTAAERGVAAPARDFARAFPLPRRLGAALAGRGDITRFYPARASGPGLAASAQLLGEEGRGFGP